MRPFRLLLFGELDKYTKMPVQPPPLDDLLALLEDLAVAGTGQPLGLEPYAPNPDPKT